mmetsp:Transcript_10757/g.17014  ORF Transcript_10757/g.17014 Transcript_10757/m.17014 type:complete len:228 (-) Transcript_10757:258-941(-)
MVTRQVSLFFFSIQLDLSASYSRISLSHARLATSTYSFSSLVRFTGIDEPELFLSLPLASCFSGISSPSWVGRERREASGVETSRDSRESRERKNSELTAQKNGREARIDITTVARRTFSGCNSYALDRSKHPTAYARKGSDPRNIFPACPDPVDDTLWALKTLLRLTVVSSDSLSLPSALKTARFSEGLSLLSPRRSRSSSDACKSPFFPGSFFLSLGETYRSRFS